MVVSHDVEKRRADTQVRPDETAGGHMLAGGE
jgi:hypothetical protein